MPLRIDSLSQTERQFLSDHLPTSDDPAQVHDLATRLLSVMIHDQKLLDQAVLKVDRLLSARRGQEIQQESFRQSRFYQFGVQSTDQPAYFRQFKVHNYDLSKFCDHYGLSERSMLRLAAGEIDSHKGWCQGYHPGNLGVSRAQYVAKHNPHPAGQTAPVIYQGKAPEAVHRKAFLMPEWWTPEE